jgi:hypothetical protein
MQTVTLNSGTKMPILGFGVYLKKGVREHFRLKRICSLTPLIDSYDIRSASTTSENAGECWRSNLLGVGDWTPNRRVTQSGGRGM